MNRRDFLGGAMMAALAVSAELPDALAAEPGAEPLDPEHARRLAALLADDDRLFSRGQRRVYRDKHLEAISLPVGGIAAGPIQINGEGRRIWQIFKNYEAVTLPNSFFAVRAKAGDSPPVARAVQTVGEAPLAAMKALQFSGEYPFGWYTFEDPELPVEVSLEVFSPLIPLDTRNSSIPCAIFNLTAHNPGQQVVQVDFLATQQNPIGGDQGGSSTGVLRDRGATLLQMTTNLSADSPMYGSMALAAVGTDARATAAWDDLVALARRFTETGEVSGPEQAGPSQAKQRLNGAMAVPLVLRPGETRTVHFVLAWHFPNVQAVPGHRGNRYANWWPDALAVARDVLSRLEDLTRQTRLYHETLYATNLPYWLLDRISSQVAILSSMTCNWAKDGFFYAYEGCNPSAGCCNGNATHVWGYPQAHARLFPDIARRMREQIFTHMRPDGMITVRFSHNFPAFDGMCHEITAALREHQTSTDSSWLAGQWPAVKKAMDYIVNRWDKDADGMLAGPQHAMDGDQGGTTSWLGSTYLCALAAATKMARLQNDTAAAARYEKILKVGQVNQDKALFNGEYFIQIPDPTPREDYLTGCYIDQMLGQWWALQVGLGWLYPPDHVRSAMAALFKYNFHTDFKGFRQSPRIFCADSDAGMIQGTWPKGGKPKPPHVIQYTSEIMSGFEYAAACLMVQSGSMREGFTVLHAVADRYDGRLRKMPSKPNYANWGYTGNPFGDDECGKFYARAMAIWGVLMACQGFAYDATSGSIGFVPLWKPEDHTSFFTAAEGWGLFRQKRQERRQHDTIDVKWGRLRLGVVVLALADGVRPDRVHVTLGGKSMAAVHNMAGNRLTISLPPDTTIRTGEALEIVVET